MRTPPSDPLNKTNSPCSIISAEPAFADIDLSFWCVHGTCGQIESIAFIISALLLSTSLINYIPRLVQTAIIEDIQHPAIYTTSSHAKAFNYGRPLNHLLTHDILVRVACGSNIPHHRIFLKTWSPSQHITNASPITLFQGWHVDPTKMRREHRINCHYHAAESHTASMRAGCHRLTLLMHAAMVPSHSIPRINMQLYVNSSTHFADHHVLRTSYVHQSYDPIHIITSHPRTYAISHTPLLPQLTSIRQASAPITLLRPQKLHHHIPRLSTMVAPYIIY